MNPMTEEEIRQKYYDDGYADGLKKGYKIADSTLHADIKKLQIAIGEACLELIKSKFFYGLLSIAAAGVIFEIIYKFIWGC